MSAAEGMYRLLLRAYPRAFREAYGREMILVFRDMRRESRGAVLFVSAAMLWDVLQSAPRLWLESARDRPNMTTHTKEGTMMTMAILAILVGAMEMATGLQEGWRGGMLNGDGLSMMAGSASLVVGALLMAAGIALLRRAPGAIAFMRGAAIACLVVFALNVLAFARLSIFATLLGMAFPILLLVYLYWTQRRGPSSPIMA